MLDEKLLVKKSKEYYKNSYFLMEKDFLKIVEESEVTVPTSEKEKCLEEYNRGYMQGFENGFQCAFKMKENADGCSGCAFDSTEPLEITCRSCSRNNKDIGEERRYKMSRLIDADRLLKELGQIWNIPDDWDGDIDETCETAFDVIENQPTAYDLDNVVRELEEKEEKYMNNSEKAAELGVAYEKHMIFNGAKGNAFEEAIEIVKRGVKNE